MAAGWRQWAVGYAPCFAAVPVVCIRRVCHYGCPTAHELHAAPPPRPSSVSSPSYRQPRPSPLHAQYSCAVIRRYGGRCCSGTTTRVRRTRGASRSCTACRSVCRTRNRLCIGPLSTHLNTQCCATTLALYISCCMLTVMYTVAAVRFQWTTPPHHQSSKGLRSPPLAYRQVPTAGPVSPAAHAGGGGRGPLPRHHPEARRPKPRPAAAAAVAGHPRRPAARPAGVHSMMSSACVRPWLHKRRAPARHLAAWYWCTWLWAQRRARQAVERVGSGE